jgi:hypothetical protein
MIAVGYARKLMEGMRMFRHDTLAGYGRQELLGQDTFDNRNERLDDDPNDRDRLGEGLAAVERSIGAIVASMASTYGSAYMELWKKGLELSPTGDQCPMCDWSRDCGRYKRARRRWSIDIGSERDLLK